MTNTEDRDRIAHLIRLAGDTKNNSPRLIKESNRQAAAILPLLAEAREEATQRLARALFQVDSHHHFYEGQDGLPKCACGFEGNARKRTQTEHITAAVLEAFDHD